RASGTSVRRDGDGTAMARRVDSPAARVPGPEIRNHLTERAARLAEHFAGIPGSPWLRRTHVLEARLEPVQFARWEVREVWPSAEHGKRYYLDPDDTIREAVKDGDTWR